MSLSSSRLFSKVGLADPAPASIKTRLCGISRREGIAAVFYTESPSSPSDLSEQFCTLERARLKDQSPHSGSLREENQKIAGIHLAFRLLHLLRRSPSPSPFMNISVLVFSALLAVVQIKSAGAGSTSDNLTLVEEWLSDHSEANIRNLMDFLAIPSVSSDPERAQEVRRCAEWLARDLKDIGMDNIEVMETGGHPVVYADWLYAKTSNAPTVLIYGHYDVQPEDPVHLWTNGPFEPTLREDKLFARGASDDKGNMYTPLVAIKAYLKTLHKLPVNVKLVLEGEEEIGSPNLMQLLARHPEKFKADYSYSADGGMISTTIPGLYLSLRGSLSFEVTLRVADRDMHSGVFGGGVQNAIHALSHLLSTLRDIRTGKILVAGYYDEVDELTREDRDEIAKYPASEVDSLLSSNGVNKSVGEVGYSFLERVSIRPTIEVVGIWGGFQGAGFKTVLPCEAHAKLACRTANSQDAERTSRLLLNHLEREAANIPGATIEIQVEPNLDGSPVKVTRDAPGVVVAAKILKELYNREPVFTRGGATLPAVSMLYKVLSLETTLFGFQNPDDNIHAPDEFCRLDCLRRGQVAYVRLLHELAITHGTYSSRDDSSGKEEL